MLYRLRFPDNETSLDTVKKQLDALDTYLSATLWIINPSGRMVLNAGRLSGGGTPQ